MSATNQTAVYGLPIFLGSDVPSWLTDWNGAMGDIDTAIAAAKAAADAAASTAGAAATDIVTINGQITSLQNTVGTHTTQIGTISGNINTINSLIGNGTPTTTDQTIIGAINELHANQGDLADLTTTDKSSLVAAINEAAQGGGSPAASGVSYDNTGSGLTATNVQAAIDEVVAALPGAGTYVEVTSDGAKTFAQNLQDLFALIDPTKISVKSVLQIGDDVLHTAIFKSGQYDFVNVELSNNLYSIYASLGTASKYYSGTGVTVTENSTNVTPASRVFRLYY